MIAVHSNHVGPSCMHPVQAFEDAEWRNGFLNGNSRFDDKSLSRPSRTAADNVFW